MKPKTTTFITKERWKQLHGKQKIQYIWDYYRFPIVVGFILLYILGYTVHGHFSKKNTLLYVGLINVSASEQLTSQLNDGFLDFMNKDTSRNELQLYTGLHLTDDPDDPNHEYTYASRIKILASIDNEQLDIVLMNKEVFDTFSQNGYLCNLKELLTDDSPAYQDITRESLMGIDVSQKGIFSQAGFEEPVYLGVIANSPRMDAAVDYIKYLN